MWSLLGVLLLSCVLPARVKTASAVAPKVREGCESIGAARMCITGNVTGKTLQVKCTAENYPLGSRASIYLRMEPLSLNYYTNPLVKGCFFLDTEVVEYTCSFTTDISMYKRGTTFKCPFNFKYKRMPFFTQTEDFPVPVIRTLSTTKRPRPLLNCTSRMGQPALAWNVNTLPASLSAEQNITRYTLATRLMAWCVLACHDHPNKYQLVWKLDEEALNIQTTLERRVENLTLEHNFTREDDGKVLECSLIAPCLDCTPQYSIIKTIATTLRIEESHLSQVTENYSIENQETTTRTSINHERTGEKLNLIWSLNTQTTLEESSGNQENITESLKDLGSGSLAVQTTSTRGLLDQETTMRTLMDQPMINTETTQNVPPTLTTQNTPSTFSTQNKSSKSFLWAVVVPLSLLLLVAAAVGAVCWRQRVRRHRWNPSLQKASELAVPERWDPSPEAESVGIGGYSGNARFTKVSFSSIVDYD